MINEADCGTFVPAGDVSALTKVLKDYSKMTQTDRELIGARGREWLLENRTYETLAETFYGVLFPDETYR